MFGLWNTAELTTEERQLHPQHDKKRVYIALFIETYMLNFTDRKWKFSNGHI